MNESDLARWVEYERVHGYIRARLRLFTTEQSGRKKPILSGYRSCWGIPPEVHDEMHDAPLLIEDTEVLEPGHEATVRLHPLWPDLWPDVRPGTHLGLFEGSRLVGEAMVIEVIAATENAG